ncbi:MAG: hypothetical protein M5U07_14060 [Xanthobacteraceae bacterium]|nr:hypothetical protein [Xanthobacteraceae bacterium]
MTTLTIDEHDAQRLFALILREELKMQPAQANMLAETFCRRIRATMPQREKSWHVDNWRAIQERPGRNPDLVAELRRRLPPVDQELAEQIWKVVYEFGRDLPVDVMAKLSSDDGAAR